jgi:hypothetical protein
VRASSPCASSPFPSQMCSASFREQTQQVQWRTLVSIAGSDDSCSKIFSSAHPAPLCHFEPIWNSPCYYSFTWLPMWLQSRGKPRELHNIVHSKHALCGWANRGGARPHMPPLISNMPGCSSAHDQFGLYSKPLQSYGNLLRQFSNNF